MLMEVEWPTLGHFLRMWPAMGHPARYLPFIPRSPFQTLRAHSHVHCNDWGRYRIGQPGTWGALRVQGQVEGK